MNKHNSVPNIRFKGYEEGWRDKKTLELVSERNSKIIPSDDYPLKAFIAKKGITEKGKKYNRSFLVKSRQKKYKKTEYGDLIYSSNNLEVGSIGINRYGNACISPVYSIFKVNDSLSYDFLGYLIQRKKFIFNMVRYRQGVTYGQWKIHESDFLNIQVLIPESIYEQQKIGDFFTKLDKLLDLQQQKIDKLELLKKTLLQKLFPKHDAKLPELRFKGFEDVWESMKFKNILNYERPDKYIVKSDNYSNNGIPVLTANKSFILGYTQESSFYEKPLPIIIFDDFTLDCKLVKFPFKIKSSAIKILSSNNFSDIWFDFYLLKATSFIKEGHARHYISIVQNKKINVPCEQEQQKIGNLLSKVDQLIELENKKLQNFQQLKKCLLQNMFVE